MVLGAPLQIDLAASLTPHQPPSPFIGAPQRLRPKHVHVAREKEVGRGAGWIFRRGRRAVGGGRGGGVGRKGRTSSEAERHGGGVPSEDRVLEQSAARRRLRQARSMVVDRDESWTAVSVSGCLHSPCVARCLARNHSFGRFWPLSLGHAALTGAQAP